MIEEAWRHVGDVQLEKQGWVVVDEVSVADLEAVSEWAWLFLRSWNKTYTFSSCWDWYLVLEREKVTGVEIWKNQRQDQEVCGMTGKNGAFSISRTDS